MTFSASFLSSPLREVPKFFLAVSAASFEQIRFSLYVSRKNLKSLLQKLYAYTIILLTRELKIKRIVSDCVRY